MNKAVKQPSEPIHLIYDDNEVRASIGSLGGIIITDFEGDCVCISVDQLLRITQLVMEFSK